MLGEVGGRRAVRDKLDYFSLTVGKASRSRRFVTAAGGSGATLFAATQSQVWCTRPSCYFDWQRDEAIGLCAVRTAGCVGQSRRIIDRRFDGLKQNYHTIKGGYEIQLRWMSSNERINGSRHDAPFSSCRFFAIGPADTGHSPGRRLDPR